MTQVNYAQLGTGTADPALYAVLRGRVGLIEAPPDAEDPNWDLGTKVRMLDYEPKNKPFLVGEPTIPSEAQQLLMRAPARYADARYLLEAFYPCHDPRYDDPSTIGGCYGCKTDNNADFGHVYASKTSLVGLVEGIVSSLANWKLYALGITHHVWTGELLTIEPGESFIHPLRTDEQVSAGTVIHTAFCCLHLLDWYNHVVESGDALPPGAEYRRNVWRERVTRSIAELDTVLPHTTDAGRELVEAMQSWGTTMLQEMQ